MTTKTLLLSACLVGVLPPAAAQWSCDPAVPSPDVSAWSSGLASDDSLFVAGPASGEVPKVQRLDSKGFTLWPAAVPLGTHPASPLYDVDIDVQDTALITAEDDRGLVVYRLSSAGAPLFGFEGSVVAGPQNSPHLPDLKQLPGGDYAIVWHTDLAELRMQRLSPNGMPLLPPGGVLLETMTAFTKRPALHVASNSDLLVAWYRDQHPLVPPKGLDLQRFSAVDGTPVWSQPTRVYDLVPGIPFSGFHESGWVTAADGADGVAFAWSSHNPDQQVRLQRVDGAGALQFAAQGRVVGSGGIYLDSLALLVDEQTQAMAVFFLSDPSAVRAAKLGANGEALWGIDFFGYYLPLVVEPAADGVILRGLRAAKHGGGAAIWWKHLDGTGFMQRVDSDGAPMWAAPTFATTAPINTRDLHVTSDGAILATVGTPVRVNADGSLGGTALGTYCTPSTTSLGCVPQIATLGNLTVSAPGPFLITGSSLISQQTGLFFYGMQGQAQIPFGSGTLCAMPPLRRTPLSYTAGSPQPDCSGALVFDFKAWLLAGNDPNLTVGDTVYGQFQFRDSQSAAGFGSTDAVEFYTCP